MSKSRIEKGFLLVAGGAGLVFLAVLGLWVFMSATATPLHPAGHEVPSAARPAPEPAWTDAAEQGRQLLRSALQEQNLPGLSVAVGVDGAIVWAEGFGWADLDQRVPVGPATRFRIGTASAALTSAAVGLLVEQGRLSLDEEIQAYVKGVPLKPWSVTLGQLMGHTAGVRNDGGDEGPLFTVRCDRPVDALPHFADRPLLFEPGTDFRYSSYGWILVSAAVEAAAGEPFLRVMRKQVFEPLGMDDTMPESATEAIPDRATFYFPRFAADPRYGPQLMRDIDLSCYAGASAFLSTPSDLVRFGMAMQRGTLLEPGTVERLQSTGRLASGEATGYGLGWDLETITLAGEPARVVGHDGDVLGGMVASLMTVPERGLVVAVTSNMSYAGTFALASGVAQAFLERSTPAGGARTP